MANDCKNCGKEVVSIQGRRPKEYCNSGCRNEYWKKNVTKKEKPKKKPSWVDSLNFMMGGGKVGKITMTKVCQLNADGTETDITDKPELWKHIFEEEKEVNKEQTGTVVITVEKIREMCPKELTGIDRTMWIQDKRKEYGL